MNFRRPLVVAIPAMLLFVACQEPCPPVEEHWSHPIMSVSPDIDANIAVAEAYLAAIVKADAAGIRAGTTPDFMSHRVSAPGDSSTVDEVIAHWIKNDSTRSDQRIEKLVASCTRVSEKADRFVGDWVHYWGTYHAKDNATGKNYSVPFFFNTRVADGKLAEAYVYFDRLSVFEQLGVAPPMPGNMATATEKMKK